MLREKNFGFKRFKKHLIETATLIPAQRLTLLNVATKSASTAPGKPFNVCYQLVTRYLVIRINIRTSAGLSGAIKGKQQ